MVDTNYLEIIEILETIHEKNPDLRFGQVIQGSVDVIGVNNANFFDLSSKQILTRLKEYEAKL